jgi:transposase
MAEDPCRDFFLKPRCAAQRQYQALHAVFVDGCSQQEAAERFGYSYDAFRQLICQFRAACQSGNPPPFLSNSAKDGRLGRPRRPTAR